MSERLSICDQILLGEFPFTREPSPLECLTRTFLENVGRSNERMAEIDEMCKKTSATVSERIAVFKKYFKWTPASSNRISEYSKNASMSKQLREHANQNFQRKKLKPALRGYNLAICFASIGDGSTELSLGYANRSAVFSELGAKFAKDCIRDIDFALKTEYPEDLRPKLEKRREKCETMLENAEESQNMEGKVRKRFCEVFLFKLKNPNPFIPAAENFVQIQVEEGRGRKLVVTEDVRPGTVLIVEQPFAKVLKNEVRWDTEHCYHCYRRISGGIPCNHCVFVVKLLLTQKNQSRKNPVTFVQFAVIYFLAESATYCSEKCMSSAAETYHQYECPCLPFLHLNKTPRYVVLVFRLISQIGPAELWRIFNSKDSQYFKSKPIETRGVDVTSRIYSSTNYLPVYHLMSHTERLNDIEVFSNTMQSLALTHYMEHYSNFFKGQGQNDKFIDFVAGIILTHLQNIPYNSVSLDELRMTNPDLMNLKLSSVEETIRTSQSTQFGAGVYATISLINHSCEPNVTRIYDSATGTSRMAIVALRALKAGEELQTSYSKSFTSEGLDIRREYLKSNYHFNCQCPACDQNWPLYLELCKRPKKFWCPNSKTANENGNGEISIPVNCSGIVDTNGQCSNCKNVYEFEKLMSELEKIEKEANEANQLVLQNKPIQALDTIKSCLEYFDRNVVPPLAKTCITRDSLKKALDLIVYFQEAMQQTL